MRVIFLLTEHLRKILEVNFRSLTFERCHKSEDSFLVFVGQQSNFSFPVSHCLGVTFQDEGVAILQERVKCYTVAQKYEKSQ